MSFKDAYQTLAALLEEHGESENLQVAVNSRALTSREAIGEPDRRDFPLLQGKEVLIQAEIDGCAGQAFTSDPIPYEGAIKDLFKLDRQRPGHQALIVATLNALARKMGKTDRTIHCINNEPEECAAQISKNIFEKHGRCRVGIIGYQPAILDSCSRQFGAEHVFITDLNPDNIGQTRYGVKVWDGASDTARMIENVDVLLITGTILANGTYESILPETGDKPYYFFGTTCAALAGINEVPRLCFKSR
ncbi:MAG: DUF364 domain-containing protein [Syntrophomonadaceae bacterium]|jgi:hypothetical protein|nr:DUF364 domain-containing protein [Syntrophomonadaceae bacterium]